MRARRCPIFLDDAARAALLAQAPLDLLTDPSELALMKKIAAYPRLIEVGGGGP